MSLEHTTGCGRVTGKQGAARRPDRSGVDQVLMTRVGLRIPTGLGFDDWEQAGRRLAGLVDSSGWWLGDWLLFGKKHHSDRYQRAIMTVGLSYQTLRNHAWVANRFPTARRRAALSFQHHAEVASLPEDVQERLLDQAEHLSWTTRRLRAEIRAGRDGGGAVAGTPEDRRRLDLPRDRAGVWRRAADSLGVDFEQWVVTILDREAEQTLRDLGRRELGHSA